MINRLLNESELAQYTKGETLIDRLRGLLDQQKNNWETIKLNYELISSVITRDLRIDNTQLKIQVNPKRVRSTTAEVNHNTESKDCFLCEANLPKEQRLLKYYKEYNFLVNPFPIVKEHFTVVKTKHVPQAIYPYLNDMLLLSRDIGERYAVFYNGPKCGASIPSHHHFQIVNKNELPVYNQLHSINNLKSSLFIENKKITILDIESVNRIFLNIESNDAVEILNCFSIILDALKVTSKSDDEPMINLISFYENKKWRLVLFMRKKHRPDFYYKVGDTQILVSPASIDMSGFIVLPREEDLDKLTEEKILQMYREVTISKELNEYLITKLNQFYK